MKKTIPVIIVALLLSFTVQAQQKLGHLNSMTILQAMPEFKQMSEEIEKQKQAYSKALEAMYTDYEKQRKELEVLSGDKNTLDAVLDVKIQSLKNLEKSIQELESSANEKLQKMQEDKLKPINDKYLKAVKDVAQANGYSYIFDVITGSLAYYPENTDDVTDLVLKKLGITSAPSTPKPATPGTTTPAAPKTGGGK